MNFIVNNWFTILVVLIAMISYTENQLRKVREWLLHATAIAEEKFGGGTGELKLRYVYDMFIKMFPWVSMVISFEHFSEIVDSVLVKMNKMITDNEAIRDFIKNDNSTK